MKKKLLVVAMLIVVIMTAVLLAGCNTEKMQLGFMTSADGTPEYVDINIKDYEGKMLSDLLKAETSLEAVLEDTGYGPYITSIRNVKPTAANQYVGVFTSNEADKDTSEYAQAPIEKDNVKYYYSGKGIKDLVVSKDIKYMFVLLSFESAPVVDKISLGFMTSATATPEYENIDITNYTNKMLSDLLVSETSLGAEIIGGSYLSAIKNLKPNSNANEYISIYTSNEADQMVDDEYPVPEPMVIDGVTYYVSGKYINQLEINKDIKYMFVIMTW